MHDDCEICGLEILGALVVRWRPGRVGKYPKMVVCRPCHLKLNLHAWHRREARKGFWLGFFFAGYAAWRLRREAEQDARKLQAAIDRAEDAREAALDAKYKPCRTTPGALCSKASHHTRRRLA